MGYGFIIIYLVFVTLLLITVWQVMAWEFVTDLLWGKNGVDAGRQEDISEHLSNAVRGACTRKILAFSYVTGLISFLF